MPRYNVIKALLDAGDVGLTGDDLVEKSGHGGAVNTLKALAKKRPRLGSGHPLGREAGWPLSNRPPVSRIPRNYRNSPTKRNKG